MKSKFSLLRPMVGRWVMRLVFFGFICYFVGGMVWALAKENETLRMEISGRYLPMMNSLRSHPAAVRGRFADSFYARRNSRDLDAIRLFEHWMDSLRRDSAGRKVYDSICLARPGIMDSARRADDFFSHLK